MVYRFAECELDERLYQLRREGSPVALEPKVFDVLAYLVQHRDRVVSNSVLARYGGNGAASQQPTQSGAEVSKELSVISCQLSAKIRGYPKTKSLKNKPLHKIWDRLNYRILQKWQRFVSQKFPTT